MLELVDDPSLLQLVHLDHGREQLEVVAGIASKLLECFEILWETTAPIADPGPQEGRADALVEAHAALGRALSAPEIALAAEDLRLALRAIGRITGTVRVEELLDVIFRDFCIGK